MERTHFKILKLPAHIFLEHRSKGNFIVKSSLAYLESIRKRRTTVHPSISIFTLKCLVIILSLQNLSSPSCMFTNGEKFVDIWGYCHGVARRSLRYMNVIDVMFIQQPQHTPFLFHPRQFRRSHLFTTGRRRVCFA